MVTKYTTENMGEQKFIIVKVYQWEMMDNKDIKIIYIDFGILQNLPYKNCE